MIYHLTDPTTWAASLAAGEHTGSTRGVTHAEEGYIHCSTDGQWRGVRERFYVDAGELLLLHVDEALVPSPIVYEQIGGAPEAFPHIYGPIPVSAVVRVEPL